MYIGLLSVQINLAQDVGDLIKVRLGFADNSKNKALHIARVSLKHIFLCQLSC